MRRRKRLVLLAGLVCGALCAAGCGKREEQKAGPALLEKEPSIPAATGGSTMADDAHISTGAANGETRAVMSVDDYSMHLDGSNAVTSDSMAFVMLMSVAGEMDGEWGMYNRLQSMIEDFAPAFPVGCLMAIDAVCSNARLPAIRFMNLQGCKMRILCAQTNAADALALGRMLLGSASSNMAVEAGIHYETERAARDLNDSVLLGDVLRQSLEYDVMRARRGNRRAAHSAGITAAQLASHYVDCGDPGSAAEVAAAALRWTSREDEVWEQLDRILRIAHDMSTNNNDVYHNILHKESR